MIVRIKQTQKHTSWKDGFTLPRFKGAKDALTAFYDKYGARITGLTKEDEETLGKEFKKDLSPSSSFWDDFKITMTSKELILNTEKPEDLLKYLVLKSHYRVKSSISDMSKPNADYVIVNETVEAQDVVNKSEAKIKAYMTFGTLSIDQKADILRLYKNYTRTSNMNPVVISAKLYEEMEKDVVKFNALASDPFIDMKVFLKDAVTAGILTKNKTSYKYGKDVLGHNEDSTIEYLNDPENQSLKVSLMKELKDYNKNR